MQHAHDNAVCFVLDMHRVSFITESAAGLLHDARRLLGAQHNPVVFSRIRGRPGVEAAMRRALTAGDSGYLSFEDNDVATEWCENRLLASADGAASANCTLQDFGLFTGMDPGALTRLSGLLLQFEYGAGATIISAGAHDDDRVFLIREGEVSVVLPLSDGSHQRIATLSSGMTFGEMAMINSAPRSAYVHADTTVRGWSFSAGSLDRLAVECPDIKITVLHNLAVDLAQKLRQANQLVGALAA
jgi:CRP-like cAMP-binding protein